mgnify:CR=1 FL=1
MSEIKTDTNQMEDYNFELTSSGMEMSDGKNTITWGEDLLSQLAAAGDPVGQKYQELKSQGKSKVNLEDLSKPLAGVGEVVGVFLNQIQAKSNDTARKCQEISKTNEKYTTGINAVENAMSGEKNSVADEIVRNLISLLPDIGNITNIDFGKIWNNDILNDWESPQNANSNAVDKGKQDKIAEKNNIQSTIDNYEFELTENGNMLMKDGDSKQVWGSDLLKQLAKAGDPVGLKYQELINKKMVENGISNIGKMVGTFINTFVPTNNQSTVNNKTNLEDNYYASLVGEDSHGNIMISNDYENKINDSVQSLISNGLSENDLRGFIDDTNAEVEKIREQIKSGKYNAKEIEEKKAQLKVLGELSKQLSQSYNIVTSSDYEFEKNMSNYFLKGFYNPSELQKEIETNIRENQSILENDNSTLVEKCTASKNIAALNNILYSMNDNLFDSKTNEKIDETANEFISKNINNYIKNGLSSADVDMILKNLKNQYKESVLNASQLNMNENDLINSLANNQLNLKEIELLTDVRKNLKEHERWETGCENELNFIFKDGITKEEKSKYISGNNNKIKEYKKQLKSGKLSETGIEICNRKIDVLSKCNELVETNYNESVSLKRSLKEYERWGTCCENELNFIFKDGITKEEKNKYISGNNNEIKKYKKQLKSGKLSETEIEICNKKIEVLSECNELVETNYNESVSLKRSLKEYETWTKECEDELNFIFKDGITTEEKNKYISGNNNEIKKYEKQLKSGKLSETEIEIYNKKIEVLSECNELVENKYNKDLEYYQDLQLIDKYHENINRYTTKSHEASYGNSREFYQNLILVEESKVKKLEEKWNIDSDEQAKNYAVKGYSEAKVKLSNLEKDKYKYTEDEYQKEYSAILSSMDGFSQQYTEIENKDTWKELISLKDTNKVLKQQLANSTNSTEINQLNSVLNNNEFKISNLVSDLGLGNDYSISSKKSEISQLNNSQSILKKEIESLTKQANISPPKIRMEIEGQIEEKQRQYNANNLIIEQEEIKLNQLTNKKLTDACEFIDEELTNSYKEKNKFEVKIGEELKNMLSKQTIVGPMQNSLLLNKTKNDLKIENLESLKITYNELSKMNSDNSIEENINILLNKNMSDYNNASSEKNKNYIDNQVLNLYNIQKSFYETQGGEDANKKLQDLEIKVNDYWIKNHPVIEEDSRNYFEKIISGVGATVCQTGMTLWHGVENAAESVVDFAVTVGTGITSLGTSVIDLVNGDFGMPNSLTQNLYNDLDSFVATDWIGNAADSIYDTDFGKWVNDNSIYKRDGIVAGITRGVGEVAGKVAFASVLAGGAGTVGSSATTATTGTLESNSLNITKALSSTKVMQPLIAGITGYGQGMEDALNDGATHTDASTFATANAFWEAIQWKIGGKINEWTGSSLANSTSIAKNLGIFGASVAADTVDSAVEGFVQPGMKMLYNGKNFEQSFKDNGGWETVGVQAALGGIMSALGSTKDFVSSNRNILSAGKTLPTTDEVTNKVISKSESIGEKSITSKPKKQVFNADGNKVSLSEQIKNKFKTVTGVGSAMVGTVGIISGNPILAVTGLPMAYRGIKNAVNGVNGNYIIGSNFSVLRNKITDNIDATFKSGKSYAEGKITADKIVTDRIGQDVLDGKMFITGRLDTNQERVFGLPLINLIQQLKPLDANGDKIIYSCQSQSQTLMLLRNLSKEGYIDNLKYSKSILSSQNLEKHLMGADVTGKKHQLYEMNFEISKDKVFDIAAASEKAKMLGFDPNLYDAKIKKINGKEVILYEANLPKMLEASTGAKIIKSGLNSTELSESLKTISDDSALKILANGNGKYGVDQGLLTDLRTKNPTTYLEIKNKLVNEYQFNNVDAERFLSIVDSIGACNYACEANVFVSYFKNSPEQFEKIFGFPLYKQNQKGELYLNDAELLVDLYYWGNAKSSEAELFKIDSNGKTIFNDEAIKYKQDGSIKSVHQRGGGIHQEEMNDYLKSKGANITFDVDNLYTGKIDSKTLSIDKIKNDLVDRINSGEQVSMVTSANKNAIVYTDIDTGKKYPITGGHWTKIMDYTDDGVIVSSWGKRCLVKFEDLPKIDAFDFFSVKINDKIN